MSSNTGAFESCLIKSLLGLQYFPQKWCLLITNSKHIQVQTQLSSRLHQFHKHFAASQFLLSRAPCYFYMEKDHRLENHSTAKLLLVMN